MRKNSINISIVDARDYESIPAVVVGAIDFKENNFPIFSRKNCISCLCCIELCAEASIKVGKRGIKGLFD